MKKKNAKLAFSKETLRMLTDAEHNEVFAGNSATMEGCPQTWNCTHDFCNETQTCEMPSC